MQSMSRLLLSLAAVAACATATAAPFDPADQARRDRNREELLAKHGLDAGTHRADTTRRDGEDKSLKTETRRAVNATKQFGHRSADRMREFGARANAKFKGTSGPTKNPYNHGPQ